MKKDYDRVIEQHYQGVAATHGLSSSSTMEDEITRATETDAIVQFVGHCIRQRKLAGVSAPATIADVGCGNGYTLEVLLNQYGDQQLLGVEKSDSLRELAASRFAGRGNVQIRSGDVRDDGFVAKGSIDILVCQRVIINLLDPADQVLALDNMINTVSSPTGSKSGGCLLFIEAFESSLERLNTARSEFDLPPIPPAHHNLYLKDSFFERADLKPLVEDGSLPPPNFLSSHYYIARVMHSMYMRDKPLKRNSEFVRFFSRSMRPFVGDYSPVKLHLFRKA